MIDLNRCGVASYKWGKKVVSWDGIYSCEDAAKTVEMTTNDINNLQSSGRVWELTTVLKVIQLWVHCYKTALHATEKSSPKRRAS